MRLFVILILCLIFQSCGNGNSSARGYVITESYEITEPELDE